VGSTTDFTNRKSIHKSSIFKNISNTKLYKTIRDNNCEWDMKPYKLFPCENKLQLTIEEERVRQELNADLNMNCCGTGVDFNDVDYHKQLTSLYRQANKDKIKKYYQENKDKLKINKQQQVTCECGCVVSKTVLARHKKSNKHLVLMSEKIIPT
tara:strand:- start:49 stop:510 length:462 start_codon:yes stop_codon:yes gene_type:complete